MMFFIYPPLKRSYTSCNITVLRSGNFGEPNDGATVVNASGHQLTHDY
ncbi:hypothetical protein SOHN41_00881 [Shewanella sp. HN-41]|nr:hypothetical protein SOHN41_00881 [Shewanella sp. HN-41]